MAATPRDAAYVAEGWGRSRLSIRSLGRSKPEQIGQQRRTEQSRVIQAGIYYASKYRIVPKTHARERHSSGLSEDPHPACMVNLARSNCLPPMVPECAALTKPGNQAGAPGLFTPGGTYLPNCPQCSIVCPR